MPVHIVRVERKEGVNVGIDPALKAVADALAPLGVQIRAQPLGPADVMSLLDEN